MNCNNHTLKICKYVETTDGVSKATSGDYHIVVESCTQKRYFNLNESNCYCVELEKLPSEEYCVYEEDGEDVSYLVDGEEKTSGCIHFNDANYHHVIIVNHPKRRGHLTIKKEVYDHCGRHVEEEETFAIRIRGQNYDEYVYLSSHNHYEMELSNIAYGAYEVSEENSGDYDVSYIVNGVKKNRGMISIDGDGEVIVVNRRQGMHTLHICKWKQGSNGLVKPDYDEHFEVVVEDGYAIREITLSCENHFCKEIEGNKDDHFVIYENHANDVIYEVDGKEVTHVEVDMDVDHDVRIINVDACPSIPEPEPCPTPEPEPSEASLKIEKWMEEDGRLYRPSVDDVFHFHLQGYSDETYELNSSNDFTYVFDAIDSGYYCLYESPVNGYDSVYEVDGVMQEDGYIFVGNNRVNVSIINKKSDDTNVSPRLHIIKRVLHEDNETLALPESGQFVVSVASSEGESYYTLNKENNYSLYLDVNALDYTIYEVNPTNSVSYRVDGVDQTNEANINVIEGDYEVVVINYMNTINYII